MGTDYQDQQYKDAWPELCNLQKSELQLAMRELIFDFRLLKKHFESVDNKFSDSKLYTHFNTYPWEDDLTKVCGGISIACLFFTQIVLHLGNKLTRITATSFQLHTVCQ